MKKQLLVLLTLLIANKLSSQTFVFNWANQIYDTSLVYSQNLATDANNNIIVLGGYEGNIDLDPGPAIYTQSAVPNVNNSLIVKLSPQGNFIWGKTIAATTQKLVVDALGNIIITGYFQVGADFDPGPATYSMTPLAYFEDIFILKLDSQGNFIWATQLGNPNSIDMSIDIACDATGNSYIAGALAAQPYFAKISPLGAVVWTRTLTASQGIGGAFGVGIDVDASGNVYSTGYFDGVCDFDPGAGTYTLAATGAAPAYRDAYVLKLDGSGNFIWAVQFAGLGSEEGTTIAVDNASNIYAGGMFSGTVDFDPGPAVTNLSITQIGAYAVKLDGSGNFIWAKQISGQAFLTYPSRFTLDQNSDLLIAGYTYSGTVDFDPGPGTNTITATNFDGFVLKLDAAGNFVWLNYIGGQGEESASAATVDNSGALITMGSHGGVTDFNPTSATYTLSAPNNGLFIQKLGFCSVSALSVTASGNEYKCPGQPTTLMVTGATSYTWSTGLMSSSIMVSPTVTTTYTVTGSTSMDCATTTATITQKVADCTGLSHINSEESGINIYPNPSQGLFTINAPHHQNNCSYKLFDSSGKLLQQGLSDPVADKFIVDLRNADYEAGLYLISVKLNDKWVYEKLVLTKD